MTTNDPNIIFSPFSVKLLMSLLAEAAGARTSTLRQLSSALPGVGLLATREHYSALFKSLLVIILIFVIEIIVFTVY